MNDTPGGSEIKYLAISRINDARLLLGVPSATTKRAYADEVLINL